jgi:acid phosphatase (class A)
MLGEKTIIIAVGGLAVLAGVVLHERDRFVSRETAVPKTQKFEAGYLTQNDLPDSLALLPAPPAPGSAAMRSDEAARQHALALAATPRYAVAVADAERGASQTLQAFSCALGTDISKELTPNLYRLLARMRVDARRATYRAKNYYKRPQPFVTHHSRSCLQSEEELARAEGAYPSARSAVGAAYALVLAELNPVRSREIMQRGREFEESRIICDVQWQSDVAAGRIVGQATVAQLHKSDAFRKDLDAARAEVAAAIASGHRPTGNCAAESAALASGRFSATTAAR